ncbi:Uroporphyrinogen decarboxylase [Propionibacterium freudenreichii]|nr:Uroporphyrinogen decarboxylase [Propionibacterium freudenreichii]
MTVRPLLLIRPDGNERDAIALDRFGLASTIDPWLEVRAADDSAPAHRMTGFLQSSGAQVILLITSPRTWQHWAQQVGVAALENAAVGAVDRGMRVFCTGPATRDSLPAKLAGVAQMAPNAAELARLVNGRELPRITGDPDNAGLPPVALIPGSTIARKELPEALERAGWHVLRSAIYQTHPVARRPESAELLASGAFSAVVLRSPSAVQALAEFTGGTPIPASTAVITAGPTTSAAAREAGFTVQACPSAHPQEVAALAARLLGGRALSQEIYPEALPADHPSHSGAIADSALLSACRGERPARTPVWFMRQAGRSLPEYRAAREGTTMLESCLDPALAAELTLQPVRRYGVDAAIFYSDIMVPLKLAGVDVEIEPGVGPVLAHPVRSRDDIAALPTLTDEALAPIREAIGRVTAQLPDVPLIGFAGAPFTVASYLVEGRPNRTHPRTHELMHDDPQAWEALLEWVAEVDIAFLRAQVLAGASAVQLFDSWVGELSLADYLVHVQPASGRVLRALGELGVPRIHFGTGTGHLLVAMRDAGADVMGVGADLTLDAANELLGGRTPLQGNIDPAVLAGPPEAVDAAVAAVLAAGRAAPAHIVNLAHGVPKDTNPDVLAHIVDLVHEAPAAAKGH